MFKKNTTIIIILTLIFTVTFSSCAPESMTEKEYGFFYGILHGFCAPISFFGKLFGMDIGIYADNNSGFLYWVGFVFGCLFMTGGLKGLYNDRNNR